MQARIIKLLDFAKKCAPEFSRLPLELEKPIKTVMQGAAIGTLAGLAVGVKNGVDHELSWRMHDNSRSMTLLPVKGLLCGGIGALLGKSSGIAAAIALNTAKKLPKTSVTLITAGAAATGMYLKSYKK